MLFGDLGEVAKQALNEVAGALGKISQQLEDILKVQQQQLLINQWFAERANLMRGEEESAQVLSLVRDKREGE